MPDPRPIAPLLAVCCALGVSAGPVTYDTRVVTGDAYPDAGPNAAFGELLAPVLNKHGQIAFAGFLNDPDDGLGPEGVFSEGRGSLGTVARQFEVFAGTDPLAQIDSIINFGGSTVRHPHLVINDLGSVVIDGHTKNTQTNELHTWSVASDRFGSLELISQVGDPLNLENLPTNTTETFD